jgi:hypothetical protein
MGYMTIIWDLDEDPAGNVQHIAEHDLTKEEVEVVLADPEWRGKSRYQGCQLSSVPRPRDGSSPPSFRR